jgi:hypothetical protein
VEVIGPRIRAVVAGGEILNLRYRLPKSSGGGGGPRSSVSSVSITDARIDATIDGIRVDTREVDVDVSLRTLAVRERGAWVIERGTYAIAVARHAGDPAAQRLEAVHVA